MIVPVYISEMSPKEHRGMLASTIGPIYGCGLLAALSMNVGFSKFHLGWRVPYAIIALLGVAYAIGMLYAPHTPRCDACYCRITLFSVYMHDNVHLAAISMTNYRFFDRLALLN